jgi:acetyl-CoA synthetase
MDKKSFIDAENQEEFNELLNDKHATIEDKAYFWQTLVRNFNPSHYDEAHAVWLQLFKNDKIPIAWLPTDKEIKQSNIGKLMEEINVDSFDSLHSWSVNNPESFWKTTIDKLNIKFSQQYSSILNLKNGIEDAVWLDGAKMNIVDSCFNANSNQAAIIQGSEDSEEKKILTYAELEKLVNSVASGLTTAGFKAGDRIVIYMPLTIESIAGYLGIIKAGMVVVSVADSFSSAELKKRIEMTNAKAVLTCDAYMYGGKLLPVLPKVREANPSKIILCNYHKAQLSTTDTLFDDLLKAENFSSYISEPNYTTNILFSSGTTKEPKSIPWTHLTPIKCASDGYYHQNIQEGDVITWTTGMGWMMAPWLIYAGLINKATIAIFNGAATTEKFGRFAEETKITILGTIPSVVKVWKANNFIHKCNWKVKLFSSTGEPSNAEDYVYLMALGKFKAPIIEYCGGTEIGGGYITGTVMQPSSPATFTTPALGLNFYLLNPAKQVATMEEPGEVFIVPPSIGLTQKLLNKDHHEEYYSGSPTGPKGELLRKHGDAFETFETLGTKFYKSVGRVDDAMNLGGIKISAVEIEEALNKHPLVFETAAISVPSGQGGPEKLIVYFVAKDKYSSIEVLKKELQQILTTDLNPLFRIAEILEVKTLPRTASNKLMRRELRKEYIEKPTY